MIDKIHIIANLNNAEIFRCAAKNKLERCSEGEEIFYKSPKVQQFSGLHIQIKKNKLQIKCSLHKLYFKLQNKGLDNSGHFSISNALEMIDILHEQIGISKERTKVIYYEIGANIETDREPIEYIEMINCIGKNDFEREMFNDSNYKKDRQRTTERSKTIKKVFKIYDKGFEMADRKRENLPHSYGNILRIETMFKRNSIKMLDFVSTKRIKRITEQFFLDWRFAVFTRYMVAAKGTRSSQIAKAENIILLGREEYLTRAKADLHAQKITPKQYRGVAEFVRDWDKLKHLFNYPPSSLENEFIHKFTKVYNNVKR